MKSDPDALTTPDVLIVGHLTRDLTPDGWRLGGAVYYAAQTASLRGLAVAVVTSASSDVADAARAALPGVALQVVPADSSTAFENAYHDGVRVQHLRAAARLIKAADIPPAWCSAPIALLAPVAREFDSGIAAPLRARMLGLAAQGLLRAWDTSGRVRPAPLSTSTAALLDRCDAVVLSGEDLAPTGAPAKELAGAEETLWAWVERVPCLVVTRGPEGAELWHAGRVERIAGFPAREVDPTGAGDVFAMTLLCALAAGAAPAQAVTEANQVAARSVEGQGATSIPTPQAARAHFGR